MRERLAQVPVMPVSSDEVVDVEEPESEGSPIVTDQDEQAPVGPSEGEEAVYQDEPFEMRSAQPPQMEIEEPEGKVELPALDDLVKRIPAATLKAMDELFRAKFARVKRIPRKHLKKS